MSNLLLQYTLEDFKKSIESLNRQVQNGCGNHGCIIKKPSGMATNGGCKCSPRQISRDLRFLADAVDRADPLWRDTKDCQRETCEVKDPSETTLCCSSGTGYCNHDGSYTLRKDGKCCKCNRYPKIK